MKLFATQPSFQRQDAKDAKFAKNNKPSFLGALGVLCVLALIEPSVGALVSPRHEQRAAQWSPEMKRTTSFERFWNSSPMPRFLGREDAKERKGREKDLGFPLRPLRSFASSRPHNLGLLPALVSCVAGGA